MSIIKRGLNLIADESTIPNIATSQPSNTPSKVKDTDGLIDFDLGNTEGGANNKYSVE
jgi:hypothetical protein